MSGLLKLHVFMSLFFTWVLETELESYGRVVKACNLLAISPAFILHQLGWLSFYTWPYSASNPYSNSASSPWGLHPASEFSVVTSVGFVQGDILW